MVAQCRRSTCTQFVECTSPKVITNHLVYYETNGVFFHGFHGRPGICLWSTSIAKSKLGVLASVPLHLLTARGPRGEIFDCREVFMTATCTATRHVHAGETSSSDGAIAPRRIGATSSAI